MPLRIIGDVHGQVDFVLKRNATPYLELIEDCEYSLQVGDMGDAETYAELTASVDPERHRFFGGNHDHYPDIPAHALGDYGAAKLGGIEFFYVRGARSSDKKKLIERGRKLDRKLWFEEEEIAETEHDAVLETYASSKPRVVITHTCPASVKPHILDYASQNRRPQLEDRHFSSRTGDLLQRLLDTHQPELWFFGHYHHDWSYREVTTTFRCVGELSFFRPINRRTLNGLLQFKITTETRKNFDALPNHTSTADRTPCLFYCWQLLPRREAQHRTDQRRRPWLW